MSFEALGQTGSIRQPQELISWGAPATPPVRESGKTRTNQKILIDVSIAEEEVVARLYPRWFPSPVVVDFDFQVR
ncbi:hypothetical protein, partial [Thalassoglobus neptunius]|uniref:hypothetical protein n=1 Tax=Thalassoglobus neptunius TaxID=1938619 RepID=UPI001E2B9C45